MVENIMVDGIHLLQDIGPKIFFSTLAANAGRDVTDNHKVSFTPIVIVDLFLANLAPTIGAVCVAGHVRSPRVLGSVAFDANQSIKSLTPALFVILCACGAAVAMPNASGGRSCVTPR